ncbi:hypothetical protein AGOR_G00107410 [Albula goreensis]|uniref:Uncharacterized protein n=1 Tax=Albula goreensis TaxID=1534307 RepID=A0A8T3DFG1_9TELE|nr:hypothetical protein AGOR_G00107410 [Albula goreensis]
MLKPLATTKNGLYRYQAQEHKDLIRSLELECRYCQRGIEQQLRQYRKHRAAVTQRQKKEAKAGWIYLGNGGPPQLQGEEKRSNESMTFGITETRAFWSPVELSVIRREGVPRSR